MLIHISVFTLEDDKDLEDLDFILQRVGPESLPMDNEDPGMRWMQDWLNDLIG